MPLTVYTGLCYTEGMDKLKEPLVLLSVRVPRDVYEAIAHGAEQTRRDFSDYLRLHLIDHYRPRGRKPKERNHA